MDLIELFGNAAGIVAQNGGAQVPQPPGLMNYLPMLAAIAVAFYFFILRPQKRDQQKVEDMRSAIKKGDRVKSIGGIYGTVAAVDTSRNIVTVTVDKNVKLDFDRDAIATVVRKDEAPAPAEPEQAVAATK